MSTLVQFMSPMYAGHLPVTFGSRLVIVPVIVLPSFFCLKILGSDHAAPEICHKTVIKQVFPVSVAESADSWDMCPPVCSAIGFGSVWSETIPPIAKLQDADDSSVDAQTI